MGDAYGIDETRALEEPFTDFDFDFEPKVIEEFTVKSIWKLRRAIAGQELENAVEEVIKFLARTKDNSEFLEQINRLQIL